MVFEDVAVSFTLEKSLCWNLCRKSVQDVMWKPAGNWIQ
jgi:hypothetical protein